MSDTEIAAAPERRGSWQGWLIGAPLPRLLGLGLAFVAACVVGLLLLELAYGHLFAGPDGRPPWAGDLMWATVVFALIIGYLPASYALGARGAARDFADLRPLLECSDAEIERITGADPLGRVTGAQHLIGAAGLLVGAVVSCVAVGPAVFFSLRQWDHHFVWLLVLCELLFFGIGHIAYVSVASSRSLGKLDEAPMRVDLLDQRPLAPYVRLGLRNALLWVVGVSISLLLFFGDLAGGHRMAVLLTMLALSSVVATLVFVLPLRGVHRRLRRAKQAELARVHRAIDGDPVALAESRLAGRPEPPSLADLIAYRGLVASAREWPFERTSLARLGLYLALPLGSWIGGALVERLLELLLG